PLLLLSCPTRRSSDLRLWDTNGTIYSTDDDTVVADTGTTFALLNQVDKGTSYRGNQQYSDGGYSGSTSADCQGDPYHNGWYRLASGLVAGNYRMQVTVSAENMFGIQVKSNGPPGARVYGATRMEVYDNLDNATWTFYLAQVPAAHAGKILEIRLFDPGDVGGNATLRILAPTATGYVYQSFNYTANGGAGSQSGPNVS